nr:spermatogenesis-associated protein 31E1-like [Odocoileus virginianus texanus]
MENLLFSPKSTFDTWLNSSYTAWTIEIILAFLCGLGVFFLFLPYHQNNPSFPPPRKCGNSKKHHMDLRRRSRSRKRSGALKVCRDCLEELEGTRNLVLLLQSHVGSLPDKSSFHQLSWQDPPGVGQKAAPAGAHQPSMEPLEEAISTISSASLTQDPVPLASTLSAEPQDRSNLEKIPFGTVAKSSPPGNSFLASTISAMANLGVLASYPISFLSCWWDTTKALFFPTSSQSKSWQEDLSPHPTEVPSWGAPIDKQVEIGSPSFINPDVQKLLEILITERVELRICKEGKKDRSFSEQMSPDYHLNTSGNMWKSLGTEQDITTPQSFWNVKDKPEQLPEPQQLLHPESLRDHIERKYSQLFWGLPSLHSESLVAAALVSGSSSQSQAPFVLFNGISNVFPVSVQPGIPLSLSQAPLLPCAGAQPQPFTQNLPMCQPPPMVQIQSQPYLPSPLLFRPTYSSPQLSSCGLYCLPFQNNPLYFIPTETQNLEYPLLQKQLKTETPLPSVNERSQKVFSQLTPICPQDTGGPQAQRLVPGPHGDLIKSDLQKQHLQKKPTEDQLKGSWLRSMHLSLQLSSSQCQFLVTYHAQGKQGSWQLSAFRGKRSQDAQKTRSRCPRRSHRRSQMKFQLETDFSEGLRPYLRGISKDPSRSSFSKKFLQMNSEKESERYLLRPSKSDLLRPSKSDSRDYLFGGPDKKHLEKVLKAHLDKKLRQIDQGLIPVTVRRSWLAATQASSKTHLHKEIRNLASLKHWKPRINISHELSFLSPSIQQMLEAHIIRFRVRHRWDTSKQGSEPVNLKPSEAQPSPLATSTFSLSAIWQPGPQSKTNFSKFLGKPQPHQGKQMITKTSVPSLGSPLLAPITARWGIQRALGKSSPGDSCGPSEAPLTGQKGRPPHKMSAPNLRGRTWQSGTVLRARKSSLNPSLKREESWGWLSKYPCHNALILDMGPKSQSSKAKQKAKEDPAWEVFLGPTVPLNSQTSNMDLRRSHVPVTKKTLPPSTNSVGQYSEEPHFKTQVATKFEFGSKLESEKQLQGRATGGLQQPHTAVLLRDYATGALLAAGISASHTPLSSSQMGYASGDTPASQVSYGLTASAQSTQKQQKFQKPKLKDPFKSQTEMFAPTEEWTDFQSFQPGEHEEMKSIQRQQKHRKPKVRDPCKGQFASADEGEICEKLEPEEDRETISQGKMFAPTEERRGFKRLQQEEDEDMKSKREMLVLVDEWRKARRLQSRGQQKPRKPKVKDPCKGPFASIEEEGICENLESEEDEEINSQTEMCPPAGEWWGFNKPLPRGHQETENQSKIFTSTEDWRAFKRLQPGEPEEMKSQRERLTPTEEWKSVRRLQLGEHERAGSSQRQQKPRKTKVRDPCKGPFSSLDEGEICENLEPEEDEGMNSQTELCPPVEEWRGFKKPPPRGHEETKNRSEMLTSPEDSRAFKRPLPREYEETHSQNKMLIPADEWKAFKWPPPENYEKTKSQGQMLTSAEELRSIRKLHAGEQETGSSQRQQKPRKPKVRDPCKGPFASIDEGEICENLKPEENEEMNSQSEICPPPEEWRGFKKLPPRGHEETKSQSEMLTSPEDSRAFKRPQPRESEEVKSQREMITPAEEWKSVRRLQPGEHDKTRSSQQQQKPRKTKFRDPCKGPFASVNEGEICERPEPEEDEEMHSQSRMLAPTDERKGNWRPKFGKYEEKISGLRASHTRVMRQSPQVRETESLGGKYLQFSPEKEQLLPESYLKKRMRHFLQCLSPSKKDKQVEETFQKGRPASAAAQCQEQIKDKFIVDGRTIDPEVIGTVVGQVLVEKLGLQQGPHASEVNHHREQLRALVGEHSHHHRTLSSSEQRKMLKDRAHSHQANPKDHSHLSKSRHTRDRGDRRAFPPREPESLVRPCQHGPRVARDSGALHHCPTCWPQKCVPSGQQEHPPHASPGKKMFAQEKIQYLQRKPVFPCVSTSSMC